jgi:hypothetical protein
MFDMYPAPDALSILMDISKTIPVQIIVYSIYNELYNQFIDDNNHDWEYYYKAISEERASLKIIDSKYYVHRSVYVPIFEEYKNIHIHFISNERDRYVAPVPTTVLTTPRLVLQDAIERGRLGSESEVFKYWDKIIKERFERGSNQTENPMFRKNVIDTFDTYLYAFPMHCTNSKYEEYFNDNLNLYFKIRDWNDAIDYRKLFTANEDDCNQIIVLYQDEPAIETEKYYKHKRWENLICNLYNSNLFFGYDNKPVKDLLVILWYYQPEDDMVKISLYIMDKTCGYLAESIVNDVKIADKNGIHRLYKHYMYELDAPHFWYVSFRFNIFDKDIALSPKEIFVSVQAVIIDTFNKNTERTLMPTIMPDPTEPIEPMVSIHINMEE